MTHDRSRACPLRVTETHVFERARLLVDLDEASDSVSAASTLVVVGFRRRRDRPGSALTRNDIALLDRLSELLGCLGSIYRTRWTEVCALVDLADDELEPLLRELRRVLVEQNRRATVGVGVVTVPEETDDAVSALALADSRLIGDSTGRRKPKASPSSPASRGSTLLQWR
jgi:hypothetical protein